MNLSPAQLLEGKTCLITGGGGSIGLAAASLMHAQGANLALWDRDEAAFAGAASFLANAERAVAFTGDVTSGEDSARVIAAVVARFGKIDVVFANAGIAGVICPVTDYPDEIFDQVLAVSVKGCFLTCKHAIPWMKDGGSIIIMSSVMGLTADPGVAAYATAKHAVIGLMRVLAKELAPRGIRVNTIHPGPVDNKFQKQIEAALSDVIGTDATQFLDGAIPLGRHARPQEIAQSVLYLASQLASFVTGTTLAVDGGMSV